jgi:hypothetical protein
MTDPPQALVQRDANAAILSQARTAVNTHSLESEYLFDAAFSRKISILHRSKLAVAQGRNAPSNAMATLER